MIVEFDIDSDVLSDALRGVPEMSVVIDRLDASNAVPLRNLFWATGGNFEAFEAALEDDPTITSSKRLLSEDGVRLYRVEYVEDVPEVAAYRASVELDGAILHAENDGDGWLVRMRFPDRRAIAAFCERCWAADFDLHIRAVYDQREETPQKHYGLTTPQHETLVTALRSGYFSIPRGASLQDVADELGVSSQAASERLRRGMKTLVQSTLAAAEEGHVADDRVELDRRW